MIAALADHVWQSTWCGLAICLAWHQWRAGFASVRYGFLLLASAKFLLPLALLYWLGAQYGYPVAHVERPPPIEVIAAVDASHPLFWPAAYLPDASAAVGAWLAAAWAAVALQFARRWIVQWRSARHAVRLATPLPADLACDTWLDTRISPAVATPTVVGALRPVLLLPLGAESRLDAAQRAAVFAFAHEFARRRCYAQAQLQRLVETLFWFHPLVWWLGRGQRREAEHACDEAVIRSGFDAHAYARGMLAAACMREPHDPRWLARALALTQPSTPRPLGFLRAAAVSAFAWVVLGQALLAGAVHDRMHRHAVMRADMDALRDARFELAVAAPGMGSRHQVLPRGDGVLIRNVNLKELLALSYGVNRFDIIGNQMITATTGTTEDHWLYTPRYDIRVAARLREPAIFEPYALHEPVTRLLVEQFGFEINVNGTCQSPCGRHAPAVPDVADARDPHAAKP